MLKRLAEHRDFVEYFNVIFAVRFAMDLVMTDLAAKEAFGDNCRQNFGNGGQHFDVFFVFDFSVD